MEIIFCANIDLPEGKTFFPFLQATIVRGATHVLPAKGSNVFDQIRPVKITVAPKDHTGVGGHKDLRALKYTRCG